MKYWCSQWPAWALSPFESMFQAMIARREAPPERREPWRKYFEQFVFQDGPAPPHISGPSSAESRVRKIRSSSCSSDRSCSAA
jgi:hypothetical protein